MSELTRERFQENMTPQKGGPFPEAISRGTILYIISTITTGLSCRAHASSIVRNYLVDTYPPPRFPAHLSRTLKLSQLHLRARFKTPTSLLHHRQS